MWNTIYGFIKKLFKLRWDSSSNIIQNLFTNIYLPDSKGNPSMHITLLVVLGIIPVLAALGIECYMVLNSYIQGTTPALSFSAGFWAIVGTLATASTAALSWTEGHKRKLNGFSKPKKEYTKGGPGPNPQVIKDPPKTKKIIILPKDAPPNPNLEDS